MNQPKTEDILAKIASTIQSVNKDTQNESDGNSEDSFEKVNHYINLALTTFQGIRDRTIEPGQQESFLFAMGETFETLGDYPNAIKNYDRLLATSRDQVRIGETQYRLGRLYAQRADWQRAHELLNLAIQTSRASGRHSDVTLAQIELAKIAYRKGNYLVAKDKFEAALVALEKINDIRSRATVGNHLGIVRRILGEHDLAYDHFHRALIEFQMVQDFQGTADAMNNLGVVHLRKKELDDALRYFDKAYQICLDMGYFGLMSFVYLNRAEYYCELKDFAAASNICNRALQHIAGIQNPVAMAKLNMLYGRIFCQSDNPATAETFYQTSIELYEAYDVPLGMANCCQEFSDMLSSMGKNEPAEHYRRQAETIYARFGNIEGTRPEVIAVTDEVN